MAVIEFNHVTKTYRLGARGGLRETLMNALPDLVGKKSDDRKLLNALDDVSFQVCEREVLGLIGANGAGKTTTLKILSRVTYPTKGRVSVDGRISALIELGAGFHPDLSGAENIYLNASGNLHFYAFRAHLNDIKTIILFNAELNIKWQKKQLKKQKKLYSSRAQSRI